MKALTTLRQTGALVAGVLLWFLAANANAAGTTANTSINNVAIAGYSVGGTAQQSICSSQAGNTTSTGSTGTNVTTLCTGGGGATGSFTTFVVDQKVILTVTQVESADVFVTPGQSQAVMRFTVTNGGNSIIGVTLTALNEATATTDPFGGATDSWDGTIAPPGTTPNQIGAYVSATAGDCSAGGAHTFVPATDTASAIPQLAAGATQCIFVVANVPAGLSDLTTAVLAVKARADIAGASATYGTATGGLISQKADATEDDDSTHAWTPGTMQIIFADAAGTDDSANDGFASQRETLSVHSAAITVTKTEQVVSDPVAGTCLTGGTTNAGATNNGKCHAIPGAVMGYTITVKNAATAHSAASSISVNDVIPTNETMVTTAGTFTVSDPNISGTIPSAGVGNPNACIFTGSAATFTTGGFTETCTWTSGTSTVNGTINTLNAGDTYTVFFEATIN